MNGINDNSSGFRNIANLKMDTQGSIVSIKQYADEANYFTATNENIENKEEYNTLKITTYGDGGDFVIQPDDQWGSYANYITPNLYLKSPRIIFKHVVDNEGAIVDGQQRYNSDIETRTIVDRDGKTNFVHLKNLPEWFSTINEDIYQAKAMAGLAIGLATLAGLLGLSPNNISSWARVIAEKMAKSFSDEYNGEDPLFPYQKISHRPFYSTSSDFGVKKDIYVGNTGALYGIPNVNTLGTTANFNANFSTSGKYKIIDFSNNGVYCDYLEVRTAMFYNNNLCLDANGFRVGNWLFSASGIKHARGGTFYPVVSFQDNADYTGYVFHGLATGNSRNRDGDNPPPANRPTRTVVDREGQQTEITPASGGEASGIQQSTTPVSTNPLVDAWNSPRVQQNIGVAKSKLNQTGDAVGRGFRTMGRGMRRFGQAVSDVAGKAYTKPSQFFDDTGKAIVNVAQRGKNKLMVQAYATKLQYFSGAL